MFENLTFTQDNNVDYFIGGTMLNVYLYFKNCVINCKPKTFI